MPSPRRLAVSYSRFSDPKQAGGDSTERQDREYRTFCERHNLTPGKEVFADRGRSGYKDEHRTKGRLGQLLAAAKDGRFDPGTVVVIEAWDRLGRLRPDRQTELVSELLRTGVSIGVCRLNDIFTEEDFGTHKWTTLAVFIQLAHQESKQKSERVAASWATRRKRAHEKGELMGCRLPAWIEQVDGEARLIPERAAAVRRIFALAADGLGHVRIIKKLVEENIRPFGERVVKAERVRSQYSGVWTKPYVALLLRDRRVIGEFQPLKRKGSADAPIPNYYPAVISEDEFNLARAGQELRLNHDTLGRRSGPRQGKYVNVFKGMLTHVRDGEGFLLHNKGTAKRPELILVNARGNGGRSKSHTFPYSIFEDVVLSQLKELDAAAVLPRDSAGPTTAETLRAKLANYRADIARLKTDLAEGYSRGLVEVLRKTEQAEEDAANDLQDELARTAKPLTKNWEELPSIIDLIRKADDPDAARLKLRPALRAIVDSAFVLIVARGAWRYLSIQFVFTGGAVRQYLLVYRPAANQRKVLAGGRSFAAAGIEPGAYDIRNPKHAAALEKVVMKIDPNTIAEAEVNPC